MYWRGHVGIALLVYAPIAGVVLAAGEPGLAVAGVLLAVTFATLPDADQFLPIPHRGPTHTLAFAIGMGILVAVAAAVIDPAITPTVLAPSVVPTTPWWTPAFLGGVTTLTLFSHIAGDALTPMGIRPFRPISEFHYTMDLTPAKNPRANYLFLAAGVAALGAVVVLVS